MTLDYRLDRIVTIHAARDTVFRFFTDEARWASWWGQGSTIDPRPGGRVAIRYPDGTEAAGEVLDLVEPERITFSYGFISGKPFPAGATQVTLRLEEARDGTRVHLSHLFADATVLDEFVQGWRYQLSVFANIVADEVNADAASRADDWFNVWSEPDARVREQTLARIATDGIRFHDRFGCIDGRADLQPQIAAAQHFMPGIRMERRGNARHCQGTALVDWMAVGADGRERGPGTSVFVFGADGRIESVTGFWSPPAK